MLRHEVIHWKAAHLLTEMDGTEGRQAVYLTSLTNRPGMTDPAQLRWVYLFVRVCMRSCMRANMSDVFMLLVCIAY